MSRRLTRPTHRSAPLAAAIGATLLLVAACGSDDPVSSPATTDGLRPPVAVEAVGGSSPGAATAESDRSAADAASTEMSILPYWAGFTYEIGEGLPALPTNAIGYQYPAGGDVDEATVAELAAALGVTGDPVRIDDPAIGALWRVGPDDGSAPSLTVNRDAQVSWYYSAAWADQAGIEPCAVIDPAPDASVGGTEGEAADVDVPAGDVTKGSSVGGDAAVGGGSAPCPQPEPPTGVPTADEAEARARELLTSLGEDPAAFTLETYADEWNASVTAWQSFDGIRSTVSWGFGFGGDGVLQWANGTLADPVAAGPYPLIDLDAAIARLEDQQSVWSGGAARGEPALADDVAVADTDAAGTPTAETLIAEEPAADSPPPAPVDAAEPEVAVLVDVRADFWWAWDADGSIWLLPAYTFTDTEGRVHTVAAVTDDFLVIEEVPATEPPVVVDPMPPVSGEAPPTVDPSVPIVTEPVVDPVTIDPATLVGLTEEEAARTLEQQGLTFRVVRRDGVDLAVTEDFSETRVNVAVDAGTVTEVVSLG